MPQDRAARCRILPMATGSHLPPPHPSHLEILRRSPPGIPLVGAREREGEAPHTAGARRAEGGRGAVVTGRWSEWRREMEEEGRGLGRGGARARRGEGGEAPGHGEGEVLLRRGNRRGGAVRREGRRCA